MKKSVLFLVMVLVSSLGFSQFEDDLTGYSDTITDVYDAENGVKHVIDGVGYIYQYGEYGFGYDEIKSIVDECNHFLKANDLDFENPDRADQSVNIYADDDDSYYLTLIELMNNEHIYRCWYIEESDVTYAVYLLMGISGIEFYIAVDNEG